MALWVHGAPVKQREARNDRLLLIAKLDEKTKLEEALAEIALRLLSGEELKDFADHMPINSYGEFEQRFRTWDSENIALLERLATSFVADYRSAEEPVELFVTRTTGPFTDRYLPPAGQVEGKLRALRQIRQQLRSASD